MEENIVEVKEEKKKNYTILIIILVLILAVGGVCTWYLLKDKDTGTQNEVIQDEKKGETNEPYKTIEELEKEISDREEQLLKDFDTEEAVILKNTINIGKAVFFNLNINNGAKSVIDKGKLGFEEVISDYEKYLYNDLNYAISKNNLIQRDENLTEEEKNKAILVSSKHGFEYETEDVLSLSVIGKLEENVIRDNYEKYFLNSNYTHRDIMAIPGCYYLIYSEKDTVYYIYQNLAACSMGGAPDFFEAINIEKNDNNVVIEYVNNALDPEFKFKIYFTFENDIYKLTNYEVLSY